MAPRMTLDKLRSMFSSQTDGASQSYEPVESEDDEVVYRPVFIVPEDTEQPFSKWEYCIFVLLGIAMLWAW
jgi:equilibrative nucleoside transporter 1/2/3